MPVPSTARNPQSGRRFIKRASTRFGVDINRTYPAGYVPLAGTGSVPGHLAASDAMIKAITARSNICSLMTYHTTGNQVRSPDKYLTNDTDRAMFKQLTDRGLAVRHPADPIAPPHRRLLAQAVLTRSSGWHAGHGI